MSGRIELQVKTEKKVREKIKNYPSFIRNYYYLLCASDREYKTNEAYIGDIIAFYNFLNEKLDHKITCVDYTSENVVMYFNEIKYTNKNGITVATTGAYRGTVWTALNEYFEYLIQSGELKENPISKIKRPTASKDIVTRVYLTPEEIREVIHCVKDKEGVPQQINMADRDLCIMLVLVYTGMRVTALTTIDVDDIDWDDNTITVIDKEHKQHVYPLPDNVMECISKWLDKRNEILEGNQSVKPLFLSNRKKRLCSRTIELMVAKYTECIPNKHITPHKIRASYGTNLYNQTGDALFVQKCMGHANIATTQKYIISDSGERKEAIKIFDSMNLMQ